MKNGIQKIPIFGLLGYDTDEDGNMVIISGEVEIVKTIYKRFVQGVHLSLIVIRLNGLGLKTVYGNEWKSSSIRNIFCNEKYCGDVLMQKTITIDYLTHITKINEGETEQYSLTTTIMQLSVGRSGINHRNYWISRAGIDAQKIKERYK